MYFQFEIAKSLHVVGVDPVQSRGGFESDDYILAHHRLKIIKSQTIMLIRGNIIH